MANAPIILSTRVFLAESLEDLNIVRALPKQLQVGDIKLWCRLDSAGRAAVEGGHCNFGYSGYFKASIFDGKKWRNFKLWNFISDTIRHYATQQEKGWKLNMVIAALEKRKSAIASWGDRTYELQGDFAATKGAQTRTARKFEIDNADQLAQAEATRQAGLNAFRAEVLPIVDAFKQEQQNAQPQESQPAPQQKSKPAQLHMDYATRLVRTREVVDARVIGFKYGSDTALEVEFEGGMQGRLSAAFLRCNDDQERLRRFKTIRIGDLLRVRVVRVRNSSDVARVEAVEEGADVVREIRKAYAAAGNVFSATVLGIASNDRGTFGLFVRIMNKFRALLHVNAVSGATQVERIKLIEEFASRRHMKVKLLKVGDQHGDYRINVQAAGE